MGAFRPCLEQIIDRYLPSPLGRGCPARAYSPALAGRVRGQLIGAANVSDDQVTEVHK